MRKSEARANRRRDIVTANAGDDYQRGNSISVLLGNGDGSFADKTDYTVGDGPVSVALGDVDGDGDLDIVTANVWSGLTILLGGGDGTFGNRRDFDVGSPQWSVALGDLDQDGDLDIVTTTSVLIGRGDGSFSIRRDDAAWQPSMSVAIGDLNGDSFLDVVSVDGANTLSLVLGNGVPGSNMPLSRCARIL